MLVASDPLLVYTRLRRSSMVVRGVVAGPVGLIGVT
jgi:hypothetical protein